MPGSDSLWDAALRCRKSSMFALILPPNFSYNVSFWQAQGGRLWQRSKFSSYWGSLRTYLEG